MELKGLIKFAMPQLFPPLLIDKQLQERPHDTETIARCATLGLSQDVCKESRFTVEGERCVVSTGSLFERFEVSKEEEEDPPR